MACRTPHPSSSLIVARNMYKMVGSMIPLGYRLSCRPGSQGAQDMDTDEFIMLAVAAIWLLALRLATRKQ